MDGTNSITLKRLPGAGSNSWNVLVDDNRKRGIDKNETVTIDVEPGKHRIQTTGFFIKSNDLPFEVKNGEDVSLECGYKTNVLIMFIVILMITFIGVSLLLRMPFGAALRPYSLIIQGLCWIGYAGIISRPGVMLFIRRAS